MAKKSVVSSAISPRRQCRRCSVSFTPRRSNQVYCTDSCRVDDYKEKYYSPPKVTLVCPWCNEEFDTSAPKKTIYCPEKDCQREHAIDQMKKAREDHKRLKDLESQGLLAGRGR